MLLWEAFRGSQAVIFYLALAAVAIVVWIQFRPVWWLFVLAVIVLFTVSTCLSLLANP